jgi:anthranilate phosphoribosyltransferase
VLGSVIRRLEAGLTLIESENESLLNSIFLGAENEVDIQKWLVALASRGETVEDIVGLVKAMRGAMTPISILGDTLDLCGTGGSGQDRFNISTASAIICASMGVPVVKHGNYGSIKANGSFNFLEALGISFNQSVSGIQDLFSAHKLCFILARQFHPALKVMAPIRQKIGTRTVFNVLGPLCNPASNTHHLLGTTSIALAEKMAEALQRLGIKRALVVVGNDGIDELSAFGTSRLYTVTPESIKTSDWRSPFSQPLVYDCGDSIQNADLFRASVLRGDADHPLSKHLAISSGAALCVMGKCADIESGMSLVLDHIKRGGVAPFLESYIQAAKYLKQ